MWIDASSGGADGYVGVLDASSGVRLVSAEQGSWANGASFRVGFYTCIYIFCNEISRFFLDGLSLPAPLFATVVLVARFEYQFFFFLLGQWNSKHVTEST